MIKYNIARKKALCESRKHSSIFVKRVERGIENLNVALKSNFENSVFGAYDVDHTHMANRGAVNLLSHLTIDQLVNRFVWIQGDESIRHFLGTFCIDDGISDIDNYFDIDVERVKRKADKALRRARLNALGIVQADVLNKNKHSRFHRLLVHIHAVCWTNDAKFKHKKTARGLGKSKSLSNQFGAPSVTMVTRREAAANWKRSTKGQELPLPAIYRLPEQDQTARSMAHMGYYMTAMPAYAKNLVPAKGTQNAYLRSTGKNYSPKLAVKAVEFLETVKITDAVFGVGEGAKMSQAIKKGLRRKV